MQFAKRIIPTAFAFTLSYTAAFAEDTPTADTIVATANGVEITLGHVVALTSRLPAQFQSVDDKTLFEGVLDQLIQQSLLSEQVNAEAKSLQLSIENERRALLATTALENIATNASSKEAVQKAYDARIALAEPETEFKASHILVETEVEAQALVVALEGGADFAELAKEKSTGPSGENGGQLGWFGKGQMVPPFEEAVMKLNPGEISPPTQTSFGWHVLKLFETRDRPVPSLEEMRPEIEETLSNDAVEAAIAKLEEGATVTRPGLDLDVSIVRNTSILDD